MLKIRFFKYFIYLFDTERELWEKARGVCERERERRRSRLPTEQEVQQQESIPGPWDHDLSLPQDPRIMT